jgi:hypothetical protein
MPSVAMNGTTFRRTTSNPLIRPTVAPARTPITKAIAGGRPKLGN